MISKIGKFITVEGIEGVGKSTNIAFISKFLGNRNIPATITREPGGTPLAEEIREVLLSVRKEAVEPRTELLLMFAARAQHLHQFVVPKIHSGEWVICDRFTDATYAYQGAGRGIPLEQIAVLENLVQGDLRPDCTIILDAPVEVGLARAKNRSEADRFETETVEFFERIRRYYLDKADAHPQKYCVIDASQALVQVQEQLRQVLSRLCEEWSN